MAARKVNIQNVFELTVTALEMAHILRVSEHEIIRLVKANVIVRKTEMRGKRARSVFNVTESVGAYVQHLREPLERAREEFALERRDTQRIVRAHKELELQVARGDMVNRSRVVLVMSALLSVVKSHVLALAVRCTRQLVGQKDPKKINAILHKECLLVLRELVNFDVNSFDELSKNGQREDNFTARVRRKAARRRAKRTD